MMQDLRDKTKIIMIVVALAFVGLMVFQWGMDITGRSSASQNGELGRVNGDPIPYNAYSAAYQQLYDQAKQNGEVSAEQQRQLEDAAFNQVVNEILIQQELERRGITVSDEEIRQAALWQPNPQLAQNELFQTNGQFDIQKWQQFLSGPSANEDLLLQLEQYYRQTLPREKLMRQVTAGTWLSDAELWQMFRDRTETATVKYVPLELSRLVPGEVAVSDAEIQAYYDAHADEFRRPASARFSMAVLSKAPTAADTLAALQRAQSLRQEIAGGADFGAVARRESADKGTKEQGGELGSFGRGRMAPSFEQAAFSVPVGQVSEPVLTPFGLHLIQVESRDSTQVRARHILIAVEPSDAALDRLYARADSLETLAGKVGLQRAAQATGAALRTGVIVTGDGAYVPGVGSALEALDWAREEAKTPTGDTVSPLFETKEAFFLVQKEAYTDAGREPLSAAAPRIRAQLSTQKKREKAKEIGQRMVAEVRRGKSLEAVAQEHGLPVESAGPFTRLSPNPVFGQASAAVGAAFGTPVGRVSDVQETPAGLFIVEPVARTEADRKAFESTKQQVRMMSLYQLQQEQVGRFLESLRKSAKIVDRRSEVLKRGGQAA